MIQDDIRKYYNQFQEFSEDDSHRYTSFDYTYNFFKQSNSKQLLKDMEKSCVMLGFYLASWGMLRGSSFLLQRSSKHYIKTIEYIALLKSESPEIWNLDIDNYSDQNIDQIISIYQEIRKTVMDDKNRTHLTLVTKILLGVFGFVPAYDFYFCQTFNTIFKGQCGFTSFNKKSLKLLHQFYTENSETINELSKSTTTKDFTTGFSSNIFYPKAKILDMYGFAKTFPYNK